MSNDYKVNAILVRGTDKQLMLETAGMHHRLDDRLIEALGGLGVAEGEMFMVTLTRLGKPETPAPPGSKEPLKLVDCRAGISVRVISTGEEGRVTGVRRMRRACPVLVRLKGQPYAKGYEPKDLVRIWKMKKDQKVQEGETR